MKPQITLRTSNHFIGRCVLLFAMSFSAATLRLAAVTGAFQWQHDGPTLTAVDHQGNLITYRASGDVITKCSPFGDTIWTFQIPAEEIQPSGVTHLVIDANNDIYIDALAPGIPNVAKIKLIKITAPTTIAYIAWKMELDLEADFGQDSAGEHSAAGPILVASDNNVYVLGHDGKQSQGPWNSTLFLINSGGAYVINHIVTPTTLDEALTASCLGEDKDGNIYYGSPTGLVSYNHVLEYQRWATGVFTYPVRAVAVDASNRLFVTGGIQVDDTDSAMYTARISPDDGSTVWIQQLLPSFYPLIHYAERTGYPLGDNMLYGGNAIAVDSSTGGVISAGRGSDSSGEVGGLALKYDADGNELGIYYYGDSPSDGGTIVDMKIDSGGTLYLAGRTDTLDANNPRPLFIKVVTSDGQQSDVRIDLGSDTAVQVDQLSIRDDGWVFPSITWKRSTPDQSFDAGQQVLAYWVY